MVRSYILILALIGNLFIASESFAYCDALPELTIPEVAEALADHCQLPNVSEVSVKKTAEFVIEPISKLDEIISDLDRKVMRLIQDASNL